MYTQKFRKVIKLKPKYFQNFQLGLVLSQGNNFKED
jgi:hypothetical protein